mmetsp:Transcript_6166/g.15209  ORF Transcript_6166/g.15209 Transcript_6166/m.15209 type:complete len:130 (-) Transcript_6166:4143-4532(-)|eukprot:CAMPEP_0113897784 /NCGR_PEP_ID=MMETSP0780_2-20120614/18930_1 /TAXON_ID=652834 /ORGANISM="Palpitomonas bilix" /LENGTH=129 /DNA_ID=CAMNT_0000889403 /DNA_START=2253 /DNA_END=2642 /DNA_ORIENTATION=+ /assembly_acc=CAM_ASM_000599
MNKSEDVVEHTDDVPVVEQSDPSKAISLSVSLVALVCGYCFLVSDYHTMSKKNAYGNLDVVSITLGTVVNVLFFLYFLSNGQFVSSIVNTLFFLLHVFLFVAFFFPKIFEPGEEEQERRPEEEKEQEWE